MIEECKHTITRDQLAEALARWEEDAANPKLGFAPRTDDDRHRDAADYLLEIMNPQEVA